MNSFSTRVVSALIAAISFILVFVYFETKGIQAAVILIVLIGGLELVGMLFRDINSQSNRLIYYLFQNAIFILASFNPHYAGLLFCLFSICFCLFSLLTGYKFRDLEELSTFQAKSVLGFFYMGLLPSFAFALLSGPQGIKWFLAMLLVVFFGDIFAYIVGLKFGRRKLMPLVSPKKTIEGALGGLLGSVIAGILCAQFLLDASIPSMAILSVFAGIVAQFGDLFESLLKRVADVKDSGRIMPGHGGILDRIDGVLFASPIFLIGAIIFEKIP
jgi:phosphatidate cytidylyltransferase